MFYQYKNKSFYFNDRDKEIVFKSGRTIPYNKIKKVSILDMGKSCMLVIDIKKIDIRNRLFLSIKIPFKSDKKEIIKREVSSNFPVEVKNRGFVQLLLYFMIFISFASLGGFHIWFVKKVPVVKKIPEKVSLSVYKISSPSFIYRKNGFTFGFPAGYKLNKEKKAIITPEKNVIIIGKTIMGLFKEGIHEENSKRREHPFFRFISESDEYEIMRKILYSKFGILPLMIKASFFYLESEKVKIFDFNTSNFNGFMIIESIKKENKISRDCSVFLYSKKKKKNIEITIIGENVSFKDGVKSLSFVLDVK